MKLTVGMRDAFVRQVMDDVPEIDYKEMIRSAALADAIEQMPTKVRAVWDDPATRDWIETWTIHAASVTITLPCPVRDDFKLSKKAAALLEGWEKKSGEQNDQRTDLKAKLRAVAQSVTTTQALLSALPEFEKYIPKDPAAALRTLPVLANVVTDFVKAGWPKGGPAKLGRKPAKRAADRAAA